VTSKVRVSGVVRLGQAVENYQPAEVSRVEVDQIVLIPGHNPRGTALGERAFEGPEADALKRSIEEFGDVFQPIVLRHKANSNMYELVAGERRLRAAKALGLHAISAVVRHLNDDDAYRVARQENDLRTGVSKIDQLFSSLNQLATRLGVSVTELRGILIRARDTQAQGKVLSEDSLESKALQLIGLLHLPQVSTLVRSSRMLDLTPSERQAIRDGLAEGAALALLSLGTHPERAALLERAVQERWTARHTEAEVRTILKGNSGRPQLSNLALNVRKTLGEARLQRLSPERQSEVESVLLEMLTKLKSLVED
jgi:ParB family chromosome partitioning protein